MAALTFPDETVTGSVVLSDGTRSLNLRTRDMRCLEIDLGWPDIRDVAEARTDADGTYDTTAHHGARAVTLTLRLFGAERLRLLDDLRSFCHPRQRPWLTITHPLWDQPRRIRLRPGPQSAPMRGKDGIHLPVQAGWIAPDGVLEAATLSELTVGPSGMATTGLTYPVTYPITFTGSPATSPAAYPPTYTATYPAAYPVNGYNGLVTVTNEGSAPVSPVVRMYGPVTGPVVSVDGQGSLAFPSLTIPAGDYVEVDFRERTVLVNSLPTVSRYGFLDFATAVWWQLQPGDNTVRYSPGSYSGGAAAVVTWRSTWL